MELASSASRKFPRTSFPQTLKRISGVPKAWPTQTQVLSRIPIHRHIEKGVRSIGDTPLERGRLPWMMPLLKGRTSPTRKGQRVLSSGTGQNLP